MRNLVIGLIGAVVVATLAAAPATALAQGQAPKVATVLAVQVAAVDQDAFMERITKAQAIWKKLGIPAFRTWQTTFGGPNTGTIIFVTEYDNAGAWVQLSAKLQSSAEWQKFIDSLQSWGKSTTLSNSMMVEITP